MVGNGTQDAITTMLVENGDVCGICKVLLVIVIKLMMNETFFEQKVSFISRLINYYS